MIAELIRSGGIAWPILALTMLELAVLAWMRWDFARLLPNVLAGDFLLLAWALAGHWQLSALALLGAGAAHGTDLALRVKRPPAAGAGRPQTP